MKIVRIIARLNVGGPARHVVWLTEALRENEFDSKLIAGTVPDGEEDMSYFAAEHNVDPIFIEDMSRELSLRDVTALWKVYREISRTAPDIVHTHTAKAGTIGRTAAFLYRWFTPGVLIGRPRSIKVVHTFHGHVFHSYYGKLKTRIFVTIERLLAWLATTKIVVISEQQKHEINEQFRVGKPTQFEVVRLGLDLDKFEGIESNRSRLREELRVGSDSILVGLIGRLTEVKNHEMLIEVAGRISKSGSEAARKAMFVVVGEGNLSKDIRMKAKTEGVEDIVRFLGNRNDPEVFYSGLDIVALTSLNEGTPLTLIEAMASGKPVISTRVGGVVDLLGENVEEFEHFTVCERGISVESGDVRGFCDGLELLINDASLRARLSDSGKDYVSKHYSKARLIEDVKRLYRSL